MKKYLIIFIFLSLLLIILLLKSKNSVSEIINYSGNLNINSEIESEITLISTGDIGLVRDVNYKILQNKDPHYPFLNIAAYLKDADLTIINLEGPLIKNCPIVLEGFTFCGDASNVMGMTFSGIDAANLANNHTTNYGLSGLTETVELLNDNGIIPFGLNDKIEYLNINGKKIALVGFIELGNNWGGLSNATNENITSFISEANKNAEIVIAAFHWGTEYTYKPTENQIRLAHLAVDQGADLVLGNHPHWIQPSEEYKDKIIIYAQGNSIFDQDWSKETREGVLYKFIYKNNKFSKIDEKYTIIENNSQPRFANKKESQDIIRKMNAGEY